MKVATITVEFLNDKDLAFLLNRLIERNFGAGAEYKFKGNRNNSVLNAKIEYIPKDPDNIEFMDGKEIHYYRSSI
jgi:hypothetical protein